MRENLAAGRDPPSDIRIPWPWCRPTASQKQSPLSHTRRLLVQCGPGTAPFLPAPPTSIRRPLLFTATPSSRSNTRAGGGGRRACYKSDYDCDCEGGATQVGVNHTASCRDMVLNATRGHQHHPEVPWDCRVPCSSSLTHQLSRPACCSHHGDQASDSSGLSLPGLRMPGRLVCLLPAYRRIPQSTTRFRPNARKTGSAVESQTCSNNSRRTADRDWDRGGWVRAGLHFAL